MYLTPVSSTEERWWLYLEWMSSQFYSSYYWNWWCCHYQVLTLEQYVVKIAVIACKNQVKVLLQRELLWVKPEEYNMAL